MPAYIALIAVSAVLQAPAKEIILKRVELQSSDIVKFALLTSSLIESL